MLDELSGIEKFITADPVLLAEMVDVLVQSELDPTVSLIETPAFAITQILYV